MKTAKRSQLSTINSPFKQTEVGVIPEDWEVQTGEQITTLIGKGASPRWQGFEYTNSGMLFVTSENVREGFLDISDPKYLPLAFHEKLKRTKLQKDDILINLVGASIGRSCLIRHELGTANVNQAVAIFRVKEQHCSSYIAYYFQAPSTVGRILDMQVDAARPNISLGDLRRFSIPLPTKSEQEAIAEALSDADALIESLEQLIAKKHQIKQGAMQELLWPRDGWVEKRLGNTAVLKARIGWQGLTTDEYLYSGDFYLVTGTDFRDGYVDWNNCHYVDESRYKQDKNIQLREHDVLVTKDGTIGKVALVNHLDKPATLNSGVFVIRPIENAFHPEFFYYLLCSNVFAEFLGQLSAGSTINHLYQKDFVNFIYKTPAIIAKQEVIATILSDMDAEITALEEKLTKARQIKQGMMHNLLTGKIRLVEATGRLPLRAHPKSR